ncbi:M10 family metallopeptidase [Microvirga lenta]|uniref:M10 family metallopeptidase n=1 Tax=Microvirga lenta TaxID=2881337 RepID=UPI001CFF852B|nr:M10 family metallopeptidase [Microvirga lenta]MCB5175005.1 M10 family metallopeptidase C-terminal domain-containing protein [Microvirga lenta]
MTTSTQGGASASVVRPSGYGTASALIWGYKWGSDSMGTPVTVTWSVPKTSSTFASMSLYGGKSETGSWHAFTSAEASAASRAIKAWDKVAGIKLTKVADSSSSAGDIRFALTTAKDSPGSMGHAYSPGTYDSAGDVWMQHQNWHTDRTAAIKPGSYDYLMLLHEIGHALGLKHPFEKTSLEGSSKLSASKDSYFQTVMSYSAKPGFSGHADFYPTTPMYLDILALQALYGQDTRTNAGNTVYRFSSSKKYWQTVYDAGGRDTIVSTGSADSTIDLRPGKFSTLGAPITFSNGSSTRKAVSIGPNTTIETAIGGSGDDRFIGNGAANTLRGEGGNDVLCGGLGSDLLAGGAGRDIFVFNTRIEGDIDRIVDFVARDDTIKLENAVFRGLAPGALSASAFRIGSRAHDANDRIVYDEATGSLFYDPDGTGAAPQIEFARIGKNLPMTAADFLVM